MADVVAPISAGGSQAERLARMYLVLSRANRVIALATDEAAVLDAACQTVVDVGGFLMCWVGTIGETDRSVHPVACCGHDDGYLEFVRVGLEGKRSEGPTGQAIRQRRSVVCDDISTDPRMEPWRAEALRRGYRSSVGLPLLKGDTLFGVLTVYADQPSRFDAGEVELLEELARDVSLGLASLEETAERRRAEAALTESEQRFRATAETLLDPFTIMRAVRDETGRIVDFVYDFANTAANDANHVAPGESLVGRSLLDFLPEHESSGLFEMYAQAVETGEPIVLDDAQYVDSWGGRRMERVFDIRGNKAGDGLAFTWRDVTERRQAERRRAEELERRVGERTAELEAARVRATELARHSTAMLAASRPEEVGALLLDTAGRVGGALDGLVALVAPDTEAMTVIGRLGLEDSPIERIATGTVRTPIRDAARSLEPIVIENAEAFGKRYVELAGLVSSIRDRARVAFPLRAGDVTIGAVTLGFPPRSFDANELDFLVAMANASAHALERIRLSDAERQARGMLDIVVAQMPVGVTIVGKDGRIRYRNGAYDRMLGAGTGNGTEGAAEPEGAGAAEAATWTALRSDGSPMRPEDLPAARSLASGEVVAEEEIRVVRADGKAIVIGQTSAPVSDSAGDIAGAVVVTLDITDRKEAAQLRDAFLGVLSHELRTPVTTIYGCAQLLLARGDRLGPAVGKELAADIAAESERLGRMVDDLLVLARAERGVDLTVRGAALVQHRLRSVVESLAAEWPDRHFVCEIPDDVPPVTGDEAYLEHVLRNLLGNAAKYGRHEVVARVAVKGYAVVVTVEDDGPGIPPEQRDHVFELFTRLEATNKLPGAGIGLFVARRLIEAMGGTVSVSSGSLGGAAFKVGLPRYEESAEPI